MTLLSKVALREPQGDIFSTTLIPIIVLNKADFSDSSI